MVDAGPLPGVIVSGARMDGVGGVDTVRGISYQQAQAVCAALDVLDDGDLGSLRVEGVDDVVDIELFSTAGSVRHAKQVKTRAERYMWGEAELVGVLRRWANLPDAAHASFEFVTNGRLGPSGEKVEAALQDAADGRRHALAEILGEEETSTTTAALVNVRVRVDPAGVGALLLQAERQVAAMVPQARTDADAREQAKHAVDALFRLLFERGGEPDAEMRIVTREQIAATLGVPTDQPASQRWPGEVRGRYLRAARAVSLEAVIPSLVEPQSRTALTMRRVDLFEGAAPLDCSALLHANGPAILTGRTGTGKSTAARSLRRNAAEANQVVLLAHAEAYLPGRLEALAAEALSNLLAEDLPFATGRQVLADRDMTLVIDGVSEVPASVRTALHEDLVAPVAARRGARIVLLGRDVAALREVLPSSVAPTAYQMVELDAGRQFDLACRTLLDPPLADTDKDPRAREVKIVIAQIDHALGDAAGNPLLFTMGMTLMAEGVPFTDRASLYDGFVARLAERSGATGIVVTATALGIVYARLLDQGRRYADPYEWDQLLADAAAQLKSAGSSVDPRAIDTAARRCGLITPIGYTQTLAPIHDSFADYLAGTAHARKVATFPARLQAGDDQRVWFAAAIGGVDGELAALVARDQPFLTVRLAGLDRRQLVENAPTEVEALLRHLVPVEDRYPVALWRTADGRVVAARHDQDRSEWVDEDTAQRLLEAVPAVVIDDGGPLDVAVRLWRQDLLQRLRTPQALGAPRPTSLEEACSTLAAHAKQTAAATAGLIEAVAPPGHANVLAARVGPLGLTATVGSANEGIRGLQWPVSYRHTEDVSVRVAQAETEAGSHAIGRRSHTNTNVLVTIAPLAAAAKRVRDSINDLTERKWV